jgi:hypothetical protein
MQHRRARKSKVVQMLGLDKEKTVVYQTSAKFKLDAS